MSERTPSVTPKVTGNHTQPSAPREAASGLSQNLLLSIAGHDPSTGAGLTADLLTFAAHGFFGLTVPTALTVQSTLGVAAVEPVPIRYLHQALAHLTADLTPAGIKIGMLGTPGSAHEVSGFLRSLASRGTFAGPILCVLDPVLHSSSGRELFPLEELEVLQLDLLPEVSWITPNWPELAALTGSVVETALQAKEAADRLGRRHPHLHVVVTGGDRQEPVDLLRLPNGEIHLFPGEHVATGSTHGTGCAFSSALLCGLVSGFDPIASVSAAKAFVTEGLRRAPGLGHGKGPLNLLWPLQHGS